MVDGRRTYTILLERFATMCSNMAEEEQAGDGVKFPCPGIL